MKSNNRYTFVVGMGFLALLSCQSLVAGNVTLSGSFVGTEPNMESSLDSCESKPLGYKQVGTISVSQTGSFEIADAGNFLSFDSASGVVDIVILIYDGTFSSSNPSNNLLASVDEGDTIDLQSGTSHTIVVQHYCENTAGAFGLIVRGGGNITSSAGFNSAANTFGMFTSQGTANFPQGVGVHQYAVGPSMSYEATGNYWLGGIGQYFDASAAFLLYQESFNPANTSVNLVGNVLEEGPLFIQQGMTYVLVVVDVFDEGGEWQYGLFPPGSIEFNTGLSGAWFDPSTAGQGAFLDVSTDLNFVFGALFTFDDASSGEISGTQAIGSTDQRWFTFFGSPQTGSSTMTIDYENTTGGVFNMIEPAPVTDSNYGSGTLEVLACDHMTLITQLPGNVTGNWDLRRALPDGSLLCANLLGTLPIQP